MARAFHLAFPVDNLENAVDFYHGLLGCPLGRKATAWADFDFFGNQITAHLKPEECKNAARNAVDGDRVPVRHFGAILEWDEWEALAEKLRHAGHGFLLEPKIRFEGKPGEQGTFFIKDPAGNALEFKTFKVPARVFEVERSA